MKKSRFTVKNILILSLLFVLVSCSNLLTTPIKDDMRSAKAGSDYLNFKIQSEPFGLAEPEGELTYKVGSINQISFTEKSEYQFIKWEVINSTTGKLVQDVIRIEEPENQETKITILKSAENIILTPYCKLRPKVVTSMPLYKTEGVYCDSVILVTFDSKIADTAIYYKPEEILLLEYDSLLQNENGVYGYVINDNIHFKNISITSGMDENLLSYFNAPEIENGTILKLIPKADKRLLKNAGSLLDIDIFISPDFTNEDGVSIGGEGIQWRYRINPNTDTVPPVFEKFSLANSKEKLISSFNADLLVSGNAFNRLNHVKDVVYYNCTGSDNSGSLNCLKVESKRIQTPAGIAVNEEPVVQLLTDVSQGFVQLTNEDGLLEINFTLYDMSGNVSEKSQKYLIAKDTTVDASACCITNEPGFGLNDVYSVSDLDASSRKITWTNASDDIWQKDCKTASADLKYSLCWGYKPDSYPNKVLCSKEKNYSNGKWTAEISSFSPNKQVYVRILVEDDIGNQGYSDVVIPSTPDSFTYQKLSDAGEYTYIDSATNKEKTIPYPAHYRIFYSNTKHSDNTDFSHIGYIYYTYEGSTNVNSQMFINLSSNELAQTAEVVPLKYADLYVDDISKCRFYFQTACRNDVSKENQKLLQEKLPLLYKNIKAEKNNGNLLRKIEDYNPEFRNIYLMLKANGKNSEAESLLSNFYLWEQFFGTQQNEYYKSLMFSSVTEFKVSESKTLTAPSVSAISVTKGKINSGVNNARVHFTSTAPYGVNYAFLWGATNDSITNYETSEDFEIESGIGKIYYRTVAIDSKSKESKSGEIKVYDLSNFTYDTVPPIVDNLKKVEKSQPSDSYTASEYSPVITAEICYDTYKLTDGKGEYILYVVPETERGMTFDELSEEEIIASPHLVQSFVPPATEKDKTFVWNKIEGLGVTGRCFYVIYIQDAAGNYSYNPIKVSKVLLDEHMDLKILPNDDTRMNVTFEIDKNSDCNDYSFEYFLLNEEGLEESANVIEATSSEYIEKATVPVKKDSFYFAYAKAKCSSKTELKNYTRYSYPVYFYTGSSEDITCELKDLIDGINGAQIYCDRPCLVMTYWSSTNYEYDINKWESYGVKSNPMFISSKNSTTGEFEDTLKYYTIQEEQIPHGQFFVIIAHFADGTSLMTKNININ